MAVEIAIPELGESVVEATIGRWLKQVGDTVAAGEAVAEIETDKVTMEVTAPAAGRLASVRKQEGDSAGVGEVIATLEPGSGVEAPHGEAAAAAAGPAPPAASPQPPPSPPRAGAAAASEPSAAPDTAPVAGGEVAAPPSVRRLARSLGVDLGRVRPSGAHGVITRDDVEAFARSRSAQAPAAPQAPDAAGAPPAPAGAAAPVPPAPARSAAPEEERVRMSRRRLTIARQLVAAQQTAAMLTTFNEVDLTAVNALRRERRERFQEEYGVRLGLMSFFVTAVVGALKRFPRLNAEIQGEEMVIKRHYDIGIAVATDEGLVVPVLRGADRMNLAEIERGVADLAARARNGTLTLADLSGGTFTITNGGVFGSLFSTPILNPPQVGILGMHAVQDRPVAVDGQVEIRPMMYVALSYDHRIVDGSEAVRFLATVKGMLEDPIRLLLEG
ncbi:MAG: 2-oxoglutarate dehydrogenase complex dihydrolipoyllysine-residue succinyltransferase [Firmicutes bacterium]|nr:2-oxoglutarate dehydrogenase complex dihydrolipoyllysine-residue succinyltransferase [Bacillota bacterium]